MIVFTLLLAALFSCSGPNTPGYRDISQEYDSRSGFVATSTEREQDPVFPKALQFDRYLRGELSEAETTELERSCQTAPTENIFCFSVVNRDYFEDKVAARKEKVAAAHRGRKLRRIYPKVKRKKVENWSELRFATVAATLRGVASLKESQLELLKDTAIKEKNCPNNVAISIAATIEDLLPQKSTLQDVATLYERGGNCILNNTGDRENMLTRAALFYYAAKSFSDAERVLNEAISTPNAFIARGLYWSYRIQLEQKREADAAKTLERLKSEYPFAFHTLIALTAKNQDPGTLLLERNLSQSVTRSTQMPLVNPLIEQVEVLQRLDFLDSAAKILNWAVAESYGVEPELKIYLAELKKEQGDYHGKISILSDVLYRNPSLVSKDTMELYFPKVFFPIFERQSSLIDPYLLISIARRESAFDVKAVSSANARGLMQLLPAVRNQLKKENNLFDPDDNVEVGAHYVLKLLKQFDGQIHLALAGYNAGPHKVSNWTNRYPASDPILFVDLIPYRETREYVASVLRNYYWYRRIHQKDDNLSPRRILELAVTKGG